MSRGWITSEQGPADRALVGGKGHHLLLLQSWGMPVPRFGVVTTDAFDHWRAGGALPPECLREVHAAVASWGATFVAVRSSMTAEDSGTSSYAGVMETYLYVRPEDVAEKIIECFKSADSDRARAYRAEREGAGAPAGKAAVVVQEMVPSETSGVAFSRAPVGNSSLLYIEAGRGLGEGVVSGWVEVDKHWRDRFGREVRREIAHKERQVLFQPGPGKTGLVEVPEPARDTPCLLESELEALATALLEAEARLGRPADLEWAFARGMLHVLQVRPITQEFGPVEYYIDTNLSESYPGLTSPFTADFVKRMYTAVFTDGSRAMGESKRRMKLLAPYYARMIGDFAGHLYYRLNCYYVAITSFPGGSRNLKDWHRMVGGGVSHGVGFEPIDGMRPWELVGWFWTSFKLLWNRKKVFDAFCRDCEARLERFDRALSATRNSRETARLMIEIIEGTGRPEYRGTPGWGNTAINDLYVMMGLKYLTKMLERQGVEPSQVAGFLRTEAGVDSLAPLHWLQRLAGELKADAAFWSALPRALEVKAPLDPLAALQAQGFGAGVAKMREFLAAFGDRAFEELKIECLTFRQDPVSFLRLVRFLGDTGGTGETGPGAHAAGASRALEVKGAWLRRVADFTREAIQVRERMRLLRGRMYGWVREAMLRFAEQARREHPAEAGRFEPRAFFGLRLEALDAWGQGRWDARQLAQYLEREGAWDRGHYDYPEFFCHARDEASEPSFVTAARSERAEDPAAENAHEGVLQGTGAAPGTVRGRVLAITDPREALGVDDLGSCILVTRTTDPAWIFILSRCAGLVSEKGSLLSHTAIVGRELGIPTVVGVPGAMRRLKSGDYVELDGKTGEVRVLTTQPLEEPVA